MVPDPAVLDELASHYPPQRGGLTLILTKVRRVLVRIAMFVGGGILGLFGAEFFVRACVSVRDIGPPLTVYDSVLGKRFKRNFQCVRVSPEFSMHFSTNSLGWRGPEPATPTADIVFIGDSFTMGYGVDDGLEFPQLLSRDLGESVVNMGTGETGNGRWPLLLRGEVGSFEPKTVVLQLCGNDLQDNLGEGLVSLDASGELVQHPPSPPSAARRLQAIVDSIPWLTRSHVFGFLRQCRLRAIKPGGAAVAAATAPGIAVTQALLKESIRSCVEHHWRVVVFSANMSPAEAAPFSEACQREAVPFLRLPCKSEAPELYFGVDGHWTAAGHRRAADLLAPLLR